MKFLIIFFTLMGMLSAPALARRGCCSHNGGVAQCGSDGYQWCNDGSRSPSCTCANYARPDERQVQEKTNQTIFVQIRPANPQLEPVLVMLRRNIEG